MNAFQTDRPSSRSYATLVGIMGEQAANQFCHEFGGQKIYIPILLDDPSRRKVQAAAARNVAKFGSVVGEDAARRLCLTLGGDFFVVPTNTATDWRERHRQIAQMHRDGARIDQIVAAVGLSRRTVFRVLNKRHSAVLG